MHICLLLSRAAGRTNYCTGLPFQTELRTRVHTLINCRLARAETVDAVLGGLSFLSLDCGYVSSPPSFPDQSARDITWKQDVSYIYTGSAGTLQGADVAALPKQLQTVRFFPAGSSPTRNCYVVPVITNDQYLIRAGFLYGNYDGLKSPTVDFQVSPERMLCLETGWTQSDSSNVVACAQV